uniref:Uncharacterized protein n=1 Tax=Arundo donax TaxID=35708 RepID=A0A0A9BG34_ARUDO
MLFVMLSPSLKSNIEAIIN